MGSHAVRVTFFHAKPLLVGRKFARFVALSIGGSCVPERMAKFHASDQGEEIAPRLRFACRTSPVVSVLQVALDYDRTMGGVRGWDPPDRAEPALAAEVGDGDTRLGRSSPFFSKLPFFLKRFPAFFHYFAGWLRAARSGESHACCGMAKLYRCYRGTEITQDLQPEHGAVPVVPAVPGTHYYKGAMV